MFVGFRIVLLVASPFVAREVIPLQPTRDRPFCSLLASPRDRSTSQISVLLVVPNQVVNVNGVERRINTVDDLSVDILDKLQYVPLGGQHLCKAKWMFVETMCDGDWAKLKNTRNYSALYYTFAQIAVGLTKEDARAVGLEDNEKTVLQQDWWVNVEALRSKRADMIDKGMSQDKV